MKEDIQDIDKGARSPTGGSHAPKEGPDSKARGTTSKTPSLVGRINSLLGVDITSITDGRDFLFFVIWAPLQISGAIWFLYNTFGWRSVDIKKVEHFQPTHILSPIVRWLELA